MLSQLEVKQIIDKSEKRAFIRPSDQMFRTFPLNALGITLMNFQLGFMSDKQIAKFLEDPKSIPDGLMFDLELKQIVPIRKCREIEQ